MTRSWPMRLRYKARARNQKLKWDPMGSPLPGLGRSISERREFLPSPIYSVKKTLRDSPPPEAEWQPVAQPLCVAEGLDSQLANLLRRQIHQDVEECPSGLLYRYDPIF